MYWIVIVISLACSSNEDLFHSEKQALVLYKQGMDASKSKNHQIAEKFFHEALQKDPNSKSIRFHLIHSRFSQGNYQDLQWLLQYNQENPSELDALKLLHKYHCVQKNEECLKLEQIILLREQR
mgnify:CR=1 FL=1